MQKGTTDYADSHGEVFGHREPFDLAQGRHRDHREKIKEIEPRITQITRILLATKTRRHKENKSDTDGH
jgi:hypothetical protein